ncbi:MAG: ATP-binding protein [Mariprofundaceae bacterium]
MEQSYLGQLNLRLNSQPDCVHILHAMVEVMAMRVDLTDFETNRVALAVDELFANIACHGYSSAIGPVEFEAKIHHNDAGFSELHFKFRDYAAVVDMSDWVCGGDKPCSAADITPGGLGMQLIHSIMDVVEHQPLSGGNQWLLIYVSQQQSCVKGEEHET